LLTLIDPLHKKFIFTSPIERVSIEESDKNYIDHIHFYDGSRKRSIVLLYKFTFCTKELKLSVYKSWSIVTGNRANPLYMQIWDK